MFKFLTRPWKLKKERARREKAHLRNISVTASAPSCADTYLVEFPKSGVTWLSFLIANINLRLNGRQDHVTWWNIHDFVPNIHASRDLSPPLSRPGGRFIKSHCEYNPQYCKVIYLVRDPRDVMVSYYDMMTKLQSFSGSMDEFLESDKYGPSSWIRHVDSWIKRQTPCIQFIRYEDLKVRPFEVLERLYSLFGVIVDEVLLKEAIKCSSFAAMRREEEFYKEGSLEQHKFSHVRKGLCQDFKSELTASQIFLIEKKCTPCMKIFGYSPSGI